MSIANTDNLKALNEQLKGISDFLAEVSEDMIEGGFTQIPIFVAHQEQAKIGEMIIDRTEFGYAFSINATTLERFIELNIIPEQQLDSFKQTLGNPRKKCCILLLTPPDPQFVFHNFGGSKNEKQPLG
ncbi:MAG: hypothetical protein ACK448_00490 [Bacteroidota bacterium]|jgi:hypothetical protein